MTPSLNSLVKEEFEAADRQFDPVFAVSQLNRFFQTPELDRICKVVEKGEGEKK